MCSTKSARLKTASRLCNWLDARIFAFRYCQQCAPPPLQCAREVFHLTFPQLMEIFVTMISRTTCDWSPNKDAYLRCSGAFGRVIAAPANRSIKRMRLMTCEQRRQRYLFARQAAISCPRAIQFPFVRFPFIQRICNACTLLTQIAARRPTLLLESRAGWKQSRGRTFCLRRRRLQLRLKLQLNA